MIRLGIDYGGKYTGLAVVDSGNNNVLYTRTIKMRSDISDKLEQRGALRSMRRSRKSKRRRLRDLKAYLNKMSFSQEAKKEIYRLAHKRGYDYREYDPDELIERAVARSQKAWSNWYAPSGLGPKKDCSSGSRWHSTHPRA